MEGQLKKNKEKDPSLQHKGGSHCRSDWIILEVTLGVRPINCGHWIAS